MKDPDQQFRLRRFWGATAFSLGILWGCANLVYIPIAASTSIPGSSWLEVFIVFAGGILTFCASIRAFYRRRGASLSLLIGGVVLLLVAGIGHALVRQPAEGAINLLLLALPGAVALLLGVFGWTTERKDWPTLRSTV